MGDDVRRFLEAFFEFADTARSNLGYDQRQFDEVCDSLLALKPGIQSTGVVPKEVANVFVDLFGAIESASYRHDPATAQTLRYAADKLAGVAREVTFSPESDDG